MTVTRPTTAVTTIIFTGNVFVNLVWHHDQSTWMAVFTVGWKVKKTDFRKRANKFTRTTVFLKQNLFFLLCQFWDVVNDKLRKLWEKAL